MVPHVPPGPKSLPLPPVPHPQDVSAERSLELPQLYIAGQKDELFNYWVFLQALAHGTATSLVNFFVTLWVSHDSAGPTSFSDYQSFSVVVALSSLLSITMEVGGATGLSPPRWGLGREPLRCHCSGDPAKGLLFVGPGDSAPTHLHEPCPEPPATTLA